MLPKLGRRSFLKALGAAPVAAPLAAKLAAENEVAKIASLSVSGLGGSDVAPCDGGPRTIETANKLKAIFAFGGKRQIIEQLYQDYRDVSSLDPDIAMLKAPSLAAKIAWQRQRNVERRLDQMLNGYTWDRLDKLIDRLFKLGM